ncbi:hypothetical protein [Nocardioides sediminis]|uniref:hypothetical protein n=1 Tax=Nocardioides sediminis TaxID=433648 RepID=UPI00131F3F35|nr:hypothetical protein [Nocardioides sediminis]
MSDLFAPLREPEPVSPPPAEEVRRRGDRLRRRRAGRAVLGAGVAAALVVAGTALVLGDRASDSAPRPAETPAPESVIPPELDLADGLRRTSADMSGSVEALLVCGEDPSLERLAVATDKAGDVSQGDFNVRDLYVYPDTDTAAAVTRGLVGRFESCPRFTDDAGRDWTTEVRPTDHGDRGWVVTRFVETVGPNVSPAEGIQVARVGEALLVLRQREIHGVTPDSLPRGTSMQVGWLMHRQLCLMTDEGCAWRSDPDVLRPDGWGPLRLGMSREELEGTGLADVDDDGECTFVDLGAGQGLLSASGGLVSITVPAGVTTPDGIGLGSSHQDVIRLYYHGARVGDVLQVRASPTADYRLALEGGRVTGLTLSAVDDECTD